MNLRNLFSRNTIACDTAKLRKFITRWTRNDNWKFENFADFLELIGLETPVKLGEYDGKNSFKCITAQGKKFFISLFFADWDNFYSRILVKDTNGDEETQYYINTNSEGNSKPTVTLQNKIIKKRDGKKLKCSYSEYLCHRTLKLDDMHILYVEFDQSDECIIKSQNFVSKNCEDIEEYLLGLDNTLAVNVDKVYFKIMELLKFSNDDIFKLCERIFISYIETDDKKERILGKILLTDGKLQEYWKCDCGEKFHIFSDGSWKYISNSGIKIVYNEKKKYPVFSFSATGSKESISNTNPNEIISRVKTQISEIQKKFER